MAQETQTTNRRGDALSRARIVEAAIAILDAQGEAALTFRALSARLSTGAGAIYWHVTDKDELLAAATDEIITKALAGVARDANPAEAIRTLALAVFDAIDAHPWAGVQLSRAPHRPAALKIFEGVGGGLLGLGVPVDALFDGWSALVNYILGDAGLNAAHAGGALSHTDRTDFLGEVAARWAALDSAEHPFLTQMATRLREHDDREQFLAGVDLILTGIETVARRGV